MREAYAQLADIYLLDKGNVSSQLDEFVSGINNDDVRQSLKAHLAFSMMQGVNINLDNSLMDNHLSELNNYIVRLETLGVGVHHISEGLVDAVQNVEIISKRNNELNEVEKLCDELKGFSFGDATNDIAVYLKQKKLEILRSPQEAEKKLRDFRLEVALLGEVNTSIKSMKNKNHGLFKCSKKAENIRQAIQEIPMRERLAVLRDPKHPDGVILHNAMAKRRKLLPQKSHRLLKERISEDENVAATTFSKFKKKRDDLLEKCNPQEKDGQRSNSTSTASTNSLTSGSNSD